MHEPADQTVRSLSPAQRLVIAYLGIALISFAANAVGSFYQIEHAGTWWTHVTYQFSYGLVWPVAIPLQFFG